MADQNTNSHLWGMSIDTARCIGCHACSVACKVENSVSLGNFRTKVYYYDYKGKNAVGRTALKRAFLPTLCMHCKGLIVLADDSDLGRITMPNF